MSFSPLRSLTAAAAGLSLLFVAACGSETPFQSLSVEAEPGSAPTVEWGDDKKFSETETKVLVEGDGDETELGDVIDAYVWVGNAFDQAEALNSYESETPETIELSEDTLPPGLVKALVGHPAGSVVAVAAAAEDAYGEQGNASLGIGNGDSVLFVAEIVKRYSDEETAERKAEQEKAQKESEEAQEKVSDAIENGPKAAKGKKVAPAAWAPKVSFPKGKVPVFDFSGAPKPKDKLQVTKLIEGKGPKVKEGQTLVVQYVGQVFGADEPFDSSYSRNEPASFPIGVGQVVEGWDRALVGQKVGSRVIVQIPPKLGYGEGGNAGAGIQGTDTIVFAVDILAAV